VLSRRLRSECAWAIALHVSKSPRGAQLTPTEWQDIERLAANVDFDALPDTVGCPDCADGGAEGLSVERAAGAESVALEFRASIPEAQPLLDRVRAIRDRLMPAD